MSDRDIEELFRRFAELDRELKELRTEVNQLSGGNRYPDSDWENSFVNDKPAQWPNEPYTDYLKRIGEYNEAMNYEDDTK